MLRLASILLALLLATPASAEQWAYEDAGTPIAYFDNGAAQFQFACRGGDLAMGFWVRAPQREVATAAAMNLAITADPAPGAMVTGASSFAQDIPLIHSDGSSMIVRGPVARQWARIAQQAKHSIGLAYIRSNARGAREVFDGNIFGAKGSAAAIKRVLDRCG